MSGEGVKPGTGDQNQGPIFTGTKKDVCVQIIK